MAMMAYMYAKGQKSGAINGSVTQRGRENSIAVISAAHSITNPRDPQSGLPTGQRTHHPFVATAEVDKATPLLYQVLCTNESLTSVTFKFWTPQLESPSGVRSEVQSYTITLTNANIASIDFHLPNIRNPDLQKYPEYTEIAFTYQKIEWVWTDGGITAGDDWEARNA